MSIFRQALKSKPHIKILTSPPAKSNKPSSSISIPPSRSSNVELTLSNPPNRISTTQLTPPTQLNEDAEDTKFLSTYGKGKEIKLVSALKNPSLRQLQYKEGYASPLTMNLFDAGVSEGKMKRQRPKTVSSQLILTTDTAEYHDDYYLGGKQKYQLNASVSQSLNGYKAFTTKYVKSCFDKDGNLIYPGVGGRDMMGNINQRDRIKSDDLLKNKIITAKQAEKKFLMNVENKIKKANNEAFIVTIMKDLAKSELFQKNEENPENNSKLFVEEGRLKILEAIKMRSVAALQEGARCEKRDKGLKEAKGEVEKSYNEMRRILDDTIMEQ